MSVAIIAVDGDYEDYIVRCDSCGKSSPPVTLRRPETFAYDYMLPQIKKNKAEVAKVAKENGLRRRSAGKHVCKECEAKAPRMKQLGLF